MKVEDVYTANGVVPFTFPRESSTLLLQAAIFSSPKDLVFMDARLGRDFFTRIIGSTQDLDSLLEHKLTRVVPDVDSALYAHQKRLASVTAEFKLAAVAGLKAGGEFKSAQEESTRHLFTKMQTVSLKHSARLIPFMKKHVFSFCLNNPRISLKLGRKQPMFGGHIDFIIGFVVRFLEGKHDETSSCSNEQISKLEGVGQLAGVAGNLHSTQTIKKESKGEGALGAAFFLMHMVGDGTRLFIEDSAFLPEVMKGTVRVFFRNARFKRLRYSIRGSNPLKFLFMESEHTNNHVTLKAHAEAVLQSEAGKSLGAGWQEGKNGYMDAEVELHDEDRLEEGEEIDFVARNFKSSNHTVISASVAKLSEMYAKFRRGEEVTVAGSKVISLSPAFLVETKDLLPIHYLYNEDVQEDASAVPGRVVREHQGATILYPVHGYEGNNASASVNDDDEDPWEVRESVVRISPSATVLHELLLKNGYLQLAETEDSYSEVGKISMARHQLARMSYPRDDGNIFALEQVAATRQELRPSRPCQV